MEIHLDCLPCMLRQVLDASRMATDDEELQRKIMDEAIGFLGRSASYRNVPEMVGDIHKIVKGLTGASDPYLAVKQRDIRTARRVLPDLKAFLSGREDALYWALKASAVGNMLDAVALNQADIEKNLEEEIEKKFEICDIEEFKRRLEDARSILVIADNAGETVFDTILLAKLSAPHVYYAVRHAPVLNDATKDDAEASGVSRCAKIVSTGYDGPGVVLGRCSREFADLFYSADIVVSKGQGNYETLSGCDRDIFFLLKAKCPVLAGSLGVCVNDYVFRYCHEKA